MSQGRGGQYRGGGGGPGRGDGRGGGDWRGRGYGRGRGGPQFGRRGGGQQQQQQQGGPAMPSEEFIDPSTLTPEQRRVLGLAPLPPASSGVAARPAAVEQARLDKAQAEELWARQQAERERVAKEAAEKRKKSTRLDKSKFRRGVPDHFFKQDCNGIWYIDVELDVLSYGITGQSKKQWMEEHGMKHVCVPCHAMNRDCDHQGPVCEPCKKAGVDCRWVISTVEHMEKCKQGTACVEVHEDYFSMMYYLELLTADNQKEFKPWEWPKECPKTHGGLVMKGCGLAWGDGRAGARNINPNGYMTPWPQVWIADAFWEADVLKKKRPEIVSYHENQAKAIIEDRERRAQGKKAKEEQEEKEKLAKQQGGSEQTAKKEGGQQNAGSGQKNPAAPPKPSTASASSPSPSSKSPSAPGSEKKAAPHAEAGARGREDQASRPPPPFGGDVLREAPKEWQHKYKSVAAFKAGEAGMPYLRAVMHQEKADRAASSLDQMHLQKDDRFGSVDQKFTESGPNGREVVDRQRIVRERQ
ncbi:hypothetical protein LTR85_010145 [Meristemomyces frigidus]|nr:hypothetical protein LTR85_010145 [Meristemomyces frigidus]